MATPFENGKIAFASGQKESDNPYICGTTKLGNPKFSDSEAGEDWYAGFIVNKKRMATKKEMDAAAQVDVSRFRKKPNRYYK